VNARHANNERSTRPCGPAGWAFLKPCGRRNSAPTPAESRRLRLKSQEALPTWVSQAIGGECPARQPRTHYGSRGLQDGQSWKHAQEGMVEMVLGTLRQIPISSLLAVGMRFRDKQISSPESRIK